MAKRPTAPTKNAQGSLKERALETLLFHVHKNQMSAELCLEQTGQTRSFYFKDGALLFVNSSLPNESFISFLEKEGVDQEQLAAHASKRERINGLSVLTAKENPISELKTKAKNFCERIVRQSFSWQEGGFKFLPLPMEVGRLSLEALSIVMLIYQGIKSAYRMDVLAKKFEKIQSRALVCTPDFKDLFVQLQFAMPEQKLLQRIDGKTSVAELMVTEGLQMEEAMQLIWVLFSLRMVGMVQTEESKRAQIEAKRKEEEEKARELEAQKEAAKKEEALDPAQVKVEIEKKLKTFAKEDFFEVLGVDRKAPSGKIRKAYMNLAKKYHPDAVANMGLTQLVKKAGNIFAKMTQAVDTLTNIDKKKEYEASLDLDPDMIARMNDIVKAETEFQKGELMLNNRAYDSALKQFETALKLNPDEAEHHIYLGWAKYLAKKATAEEAKKTIEKGLKMRNNVEMAFIFLGRIAKALKDKNEADRCFNKALELNPGSDLANAELRALARMK